MRVNDWRTGIGKRRVDHMRVNESAVEHGGARTGGRVYVQIHLQTAPVVEVSAISPSL
mgnify:CR=1 FL=1